MNEIQFQKPHTNIFAFVKMDTTEGRLYFDVDIQEYDPATEENTLIKRDSLTPMQFIDWLGNDGFKVS